jgi:hypothetical protein
LLNSPRLDSFTVADYPGILRCLSWISSIFACIGALTRLRAGLVDDFALGRRDKRVHAPRDVERSPNLSVPFVTVTSASSATSAVAARPAAALDWARSEAILVYAGPRDETTAMLFGVSDGGRAGLYWAPQLSAKLPGNPPSQRGCK